MHSHKHPMRLNQLPLTKYVFLLIFFTLSVAPMSYGSPLCEEQMDELSRLEKDTLSAWPREEKKIRFELNTGVPGQKVAFASPLTEWQPSRFILAETSPGIYSLEIPAPWMDTLPYKFVVDGVWKADPTNPNTDPSGNSIAKIGFKSDPLLETKPERPWELTQFELSDQSGESRPIYVLSPPKSVTKKQVIIYFQDGGDFLSRTHLDNWVANISARQDMPSITAVLIPPLHRMEEYNMSDNYVRFLTDKVVPSVEQKLGKTFSPSQRVIAGASMGGLISFYAGITAPKTFGTVISQSGSFWYEDLAILKRMKPSTDPNQKIYMSAGFFESVDHMLQGNHKTVTKAVELGYKVTYEQFPTRHDYFDWTNELTRIAEVLFTPAAIE